MASGTPVGNMIIKVDLDAVGVEKSMTGLQRQLRSSNKAMGAQLSAFERSDKSARKYGVLIEGLTNRHKIQAQMVEEAKKRYEDMSSAYGENSVKAQQAAQNLNEQIARYQETGRELENVTAEFKEFQRVQEIQSKGWYKVADGMDQWGGKLKSAGSAMNDVGSKMTKGITLPAIGAATAVGGLFAAFGWKRLTGLDSAQAKLKGLGYSAKDVERISKDVEKAIEGGMTTFAEGTDIAAGALAAGVKEGKELQRYIKLVGDAAVGANRPVEEMAQIFNRVEGSGKLMTNELNSIESSMPGFSKAMSKHLRVSSEKLREMVTDGKVSSKEFLKVMDNFAGDMASEYSKSWDGMVANTKAYIGIIGESFLKGVFEDSKKSLADFIEILKSPEIQRRAEEMGEVARKSFAKMKDSIMEVVDWYQNLDDGQKTMIKRLGMVAIAGGPVLQFTGKLTSGLGTVLQFTGRLSKAIGLSSTAGLLGSMSLLGPAAVGGVAVAGVVGLGAAIYKSQKRADKAVESKLELAETNLENAKASLEHTKSVQKDVEATADLIEGTSEYIEKTDDLIGKYDVLTDKSKLSRDEFLEFLGVQTELSLVKSPERIDELNGRMEQLQKKSGLSKDEMSELVGVNESLIEIIPGTTEATNEYGDAVAGATDKVKNLRDEELERMRIDTYNKLSDDVRGVNGALERQKEVTGEIFELQDNVASSESVIKGYKEDIAAIEDDIKLKSAEANVLQEKKADATGREKRELHGQWIELQRNIGEQVKKKRKLEENLGVTEQELEVNKESLEELKEEEEWLSATIDANLRNKDLLVESLESQYDINIEKGNEVKSIEKVIKAREKEIEKIEEIIKKEGDADGELQKKIDKLEKGNGELEKEKTNVGNIIKTVEEQAEKYGEVALAKEKVNTEGGKQKENGKENVKLTNLWKKALEGLNAETDKGTGKQKKQGEQIDANNKKTDQGTKKEQERTKEAGKDVDKNVKVKDNGTTDKINKKAQEPKNKNVHLKDKGTADVNRKATEPKNKSVNLVAKGAAAVNRVASSPVRKVVNFVGKGLGKLKFWAKGTPPQGHPGGDAVMGERGRELVKLPNGKSFLTPNKATFFPGLPKGAHVIPNHKTERLLRSTPHYASGTSGWENALQQSELAKLLALNETNDSTVVVSRSRQRNESNREEVSLLRRQVELLTELVLSSRNIEQKPVISGGDIQRTYDTMDARESAKHNVFTGKPRRD